MPLYEHIPLVGRLLRSEELLKMYDPDALEQLRKEYGGAMGFGHGVTFGNEAFNTFEKATIRDSKRFADTKMPDGSSLLSKLNTPAKKDPSKQELEAHKSSAKYIKDTINAILEPTDQYDKAKTDYQESIAAFKELAKLVPTKHSAQDFAGLLNDINGKALHAIEAQHKKEKEKLEQIFAEDKNLKDDLQVVLGISDPQALTEAVAGVKTSMLNDLEATQAKQLEEFKKATSASVNDLHKAAAAQMSELLFIANLYKNNETMRQKIEDLAAENRKKAGTPKATSVEIGITKDVISLSGITIADLGTITSITKKEITQDPERPGVFTMKYDNAPTDIFKNINYFQSRQQKPKADMMLLAQAVRASGFDTVTYDIDIQPQEAAMDRAREAYEAAVRSGFTQHKSGKAEKNDPPDHIIIKINGTPIRADQLFADHQTRLGIMHDKATKTAERLKQITEFKPQSATDLNAIKTDLQDLRTKQKEKEAAKEAQAANPNQLAQP